MATGQDHASPLRTSIRELNRPMPWVNASDRLHDEVDEALLYSCGLHFRSLGGEDGFKCCVCIEKGDSGAPDRGSD